jgi:hypothetical protein
MVLLAVQKLVHGSWALLVLEPPIFEHLLLLGVDDGE